MSLLSPFLTLSAVLFAISFQLIAEFIALPWYHAPHQAKPNASYISLRFISDNDKDSYVCMYNTYRWKGTMRSA